VPDTESVTVIVEEFKITFFPEVPLDWSHDSLLAFSLFSCNQKHIHGGVISTFMLRVTCFHRGFHSFGLLRDLLGRIAWVKALEGREAQESWSLFKDHLLQAQEQCIPTKRKSGSNTRRPI